jgi:hypothetical protein
MSLYRILIQKDTVYEVVSSIAEYGYAHIIEDPDPNNDNKFFKKNAAKCDSVFRKIK